MKKCYQCGSIKPHSEFSRNACRRDGLQTNCKTCRKQLYRKNQEREIEYQKAYIKANPEKVAQWRENYAKTPEFAQKSKAREITNRAVKNGKLFKPASCECCDKTFPKSKIQAHHHDYTKPFDVVWLCARCHGLAHRLGNERTAV